MRSLILVFGDQLNHDSGVFDGFDQQKDAVWMAENKHEAEHVWCHKQRLVLFFSAMRHFRDELQSRNRPVHYHALTADARQDSGANFSELLQQSIRQLRPDKLLAALPGDYRVLEMLQATAKQAKLPLEIRPDNHFYASIDDFRSYADGKKSLVMEGFYRRQRRAHNILMDDDDQPVGGDWNYDHDNRESFSREGPGKVPRPHSFQADETTNEVQEMVAQRFADHPGDLDGFNLPVTHAQARTMLRDFVTRSLPNFGRYEDAMWTDEPFLYHSRLSVPLNLKLLNPRSCIEKAVDAYHAGDAPIASVEGFVRQILGWREFVRGVYWTRMPGYIEKNFFGAEREPPSFYWDGKTEMNCVRESMSHVSKYGYSHHIHRLMVLGNLAMTLGVHPRKFHDWHMAMYLDAVDWVSLPNTLGMSQFGDGGIIGTKPYAASGNYINKMSDFCKSCPFDYRESVGDKACPITTFYWDFLDRHYDQLNSNARMKLQLKHVEKKRETGQIKEIRVHADNLRNRWYDDPS